MPIINIHLLFAQFFDDHAILGAMSIEMIAQYLSIFARFGLNIFGVNWSLTLRSILESDIAQHFSRAVQPNHVHFLPFDFLSPKEFAQVFLHSITFRASEWCIFQAMKSSEHRNDVIMRANESALAGNFVVHLESDLKFVGDLGEKALQKVFTVAGNKPQFIAKMFYNCECKLHEEFLKFLFANHKDLTLEFAQREDVQEHLLDKHVQLFLRFVKQGVLPVVAFPCRFIDELGMDVQEFIRSGMMLGYFFAQKTVPIIFDRRDGRFICEYIQKTYDRGAAIEIYSRLLQKTLNNCVMIGAELLRVCDMLLAFGANPFLEMKGHFYSAISALRCSYKISKEKDLSRVFSLILWRMIGPLASAQHPRIGASSPVQCIDSFVCEKIARILHENLYFGND